MVFIYILELNNNKYYVGKTDLPEIRLDAHFDNNGSAWTKKYKPQAIVEIIPDCSEFDEDKYTKIYMKKFGIDNVRGGSYSQIILNKDQLINIRRELVSSMDECFRCGLKGHFVRYCNVPKDVCEQIAKYKKKLVKKEDKHTEMNQSSNMFMEITGLKGAKLDSLEEKIVKVREKLIELELEYSFCGNSEPSITKRVYLNVEYKNKDHAKSLGALWDRDEKSWYTMEDNQNYSELIKIYGRN